MSEQSPWRVVAPLIGAVVAFLDTDAVYGADHDRTLTAKTALRDAFEQLAGDDAASDRAEFRVLRGGLEDPAEDPVDPLA